MLKQINLSNLTKLQVLDVNNEVKILSSLSNENIVKYYSSFYDEKEHNFNIIMEYCDGGDLEQLIKKYRDQSKLIETNTIYLILSQICYGLKYLHLKRILHRDLKPLNIFLFKDGRVKIGDLGVAKALLYNSCAKTFVGTPFYLSPEICEEKPYNDKSDIWSLGCIIYELVTLKHPFTCKSLPSLISKIIKAKYEPITNINIRSYYKDYIGLIDMMLNKNSNKRPSITDLLNHKSIDIINT